MKKILLVLVMVGLFGIFLSSDGYALVKPEYVVKIATIAPEMSGWGPVMYKFRDRVAKETNGRVKILMYWGGVMGDEPDLIRKVRLGQIQGAMVTFTALNRVVPELAVVDLPFIFNNRDEAAYIVDKFYGKFNDYFEKQNGLLGATFEVGWWDFYSMKKCTNRDDFRKLTVEGLASDVFVETFRAWGIPMVAFPPVDFIPSVQTGVVGASTGPLQYYVGAQLMTVAPYYLKVHWLYQHGGAMMDKKYFDKMPEDLRKIVLTAMKDVGSGATKSTRDSNDKLAPNVAKIGIIVTEPSPEVVEDFKTASRPVWDKLAQKKLYTPALLNEILGAIEEYRKTHSTKRDYWF